MKSESSTVWAAVAGLSTGVVLGLAFYTRLLAQEESNNSLEKKKLQEEADAFIQLIGKRKTILGEDLNKSLADISARVLQYAFDRLDREHKGFVTTDVLEEAFTSDRFCMPIFREYCHSTPAEAVAQIDSDKDGIVSFGEFLLFFEKRANVPVTYHYGCLSGIDLLSASDKHVWGYDGILGPDNWSKLSLSSKAAVEGKKQSPIDIITSKIVIDPSAPQVEFLPSKNSKAVITNNGHTIVVMYEQNGGMLRIKDETYKLAQFHFHAGSEHLLNGIRYPLELHLVHVNEKDPSKLAVVGALFEIGDHSTFLGQFDDKIPLMNVGATAPLASVDLTSLNLCTDCIIQYEGSLTTPPCSENVQWCVSRMPLSLSEEQLYNLQQKMAQSNFRPVQPLNNRSLISACKK